MTTSTLGKTALTEHTGDALASGTLSNGSARMGGDIDNTSNKHEYLLVKVNGTQNASHDENDVIYMMMSYSDDGTNWTNPVDETGAGLGPTINSVVPVPIGLVGDVTAGSPEDFAKDITIKGIPPAHIKVSFFNLTGLDITAFTADFFTYSDLWTTT